MPADHRVQSRPPEHPDDAAPDDSALLRLARSGDTAALDALCRRNWRPAAYLLQIAGNLARDRWRAGLSRTVATQHMPDRAAPGPGPDAVVIAGDRRLVLLAALDRLTPDHRAVLRLRILEGRTTREVAALTKRSEPAVRQLQVRALAALRTALGDQIRNATADR